MRNLRLVWPLASVRMSRWGWLALDFDVHPRSGMSFIMIKWGYRDCFVPSPLSTALELSSTSRRCMDGSPTKMGSKPLHSNDRTMPAWSTTAWWERQASSQVSRVSMDPMCTMCSEACRSTRKTSWATLPVRSSRATKSSRCCRRGRLAAEPASDEVSASPRPSMTWSLRAKWSCCSTSRQRSASWAASASARILSKSSMPLHLANDRNQDVPSLCNWIREADLRDFAVAQGIRSLLTDITNCAFEMPTLLVDRFGHPSVTIFFQARACSAVISCPPHGHRIPIAYRQQKFARAEQRRLLQMATLHFWKST